MNGQNIRIRLKAFDHRILDSSTREIVNTAKRRPSSHAIDVISSMSTEMLSPGITISVPAGSVIVPVTSVVRK